MRLRRPTIFETTTGIGASQNWTDKHGGGSLRFTSSSPEKGIEYDLYFDVSYGNTNVSWNLSILET